ncbi:uncharacterized protein LOC131667105 [Phymastichus coffea]|uniref:uncharacterized protein LOC131667105 n=1 Tax=Phymastichus coffea TaxID=108790 RepID=UPI00273A7A44|nr:uncharacterized protein LOC131667105 [Phymastichus coffea]
MILQLFFFRFLVFATVQAFPLDSDTEKISPGDASYANAKKCDAKLTWYRDTTKKLQDLYGKYYKEYQNFKKTNNPNVSEIETMHSEYEEMIMNALHRYETDSEKIYKISDDSARLVFCQKEINWFKVLDQNLTRMGTNIKTDVLNVLDVLGVSKETRDSLDETLGRIVNFLFIIDMSKNIFKDVRSLFDEVRVVTEAGISLEKIYKVNPDGEVIEKAKEIDENYREVFESKNEIMLNNEINELADEERITKAKSRVADNEEWNINEEEVLGNGIEDDNIFEKPKEEPHEFKRPLEKSKSFEIKRFPG